ncbi:DUF3157 family protein [Shewanella acanthi]|uniref:DUF3157 family protein n=1 Tax=Shewanella acanthi TaxID=2864212 RepID=UPI001C658EEF|nr:DUF3157 family protein [Shewanella acanthi]QYJ78957.1 DUF3157 family protein [Shewanella acanthi]
MIRGFRLNLFHVLYALILSSPVWAADVATLTLENGTKVRLKDDFTWEYIITETKRAPEAATATTQTTAINPTVTPTTNSAPNLASSAAPTAITTLTQDVMTTPDILGTTAKEDIKVSFKQSQWKGDKLGLTFELSSNSSKHVTLVKVETSFFADNGTLLKTEKLDVWEAIFRMPETYLRKGEQRNSAVIWVEGIDRSQWQKQLLSLKITEINSR